MKHRENFWRPLLWLAVTLAVVSGCSESVVPKFDGPRGTSSSALEVTGPALVADLNTQLPANAGSAPAGFVAMGSTVFFVAQEASSGRELWMSDGTPAGTRLVADLRPGAESSDPSGLTVMGGQVYFVADAGSLGRELWRTDGTPAGTVPVKDIAPGTPTSSPGNLKVFNGLLYFSANGELWRSDGTPEGTVLFKGVLSDNFRGSPENLTVAGNQLFFTAYGAGTGRELWRSDGTPEGTLLLKDIAPGSRDGFISQLVSVGDRVFFVGFEPSARGSIWTSDGTPGGTRLAYDPTPGDPYDGMAIQWLTPVGGMLYFVSAGRYGGSLYGYEVWKTDGTTASLVADIAPGSASSWPEELVAVGTTLYFRANEPGTGYELWKLETLSGSLQRLANIRSGSADSTPQQLTAVGNLLYFTADDGMTGRELWRTDGTPAGTVQVSDIGLGTNSSTPEGLTAAGTRLFFSAERGTVGRELWSTESSGVSASLLKDILVPTASSDPQALTVLNGGLYFTADVQGFGREPWVNDSTGTRLIKDIYPGSWGSSPRQLVPLKGALVFDAEDPVYGRELWTSNGTEAGTRLLKELSPGPATWTAPYGLQAVGDRLYFIGNDGRTGFEPWVSDGTEAGTRLLKDLSAGTQYDTSLREGFAGFKNQAFFGAYQPSDMLWKSDGTSAGTVSLGYVVPFLNRGIAATPGFFYFVGANYGSYDMELWRSDGTNTGTRLVRDIAALGSGLPDDFALLGTTLYFSASHDGTQRDLWRSDGTGEGTWPVKQVPGGKGFNPRYLVEVNGALLFQASTQETGAELWRSDGTLEGTVRVKDTAPGAVNGVAVQPMLALEPEGLVVFAASDGTSGVEPWISDGTEAGTHPLGDLAPGAASSNPRLFTRQGNDIFFVANDGTTGFELWRVRLSVPPDTTPPTIICPAALSAEALSSAGAPVSFPPAAATDDRLGQPALSYSQAPGSVFRLGTTSVTATAKDAYGNTASCSFNVTVVDTSAPKVTCPANVTAEATSASGATVRFPGVTVSDASATQVTYSKAPGTVFPLGTTAVTATATDAGGYSASCTFNVTVRDTRGPVMVCPAGVAAEATSASGALVNYSPASASEAVSPPVTVSYSQASKTLFPLGVTVVTVTGTDALGNKSTCSFSVTVRDTQPPLVSCPKPAPFEATSASGTLVSYPPASALDAVSPEPVLTYSHASGTVFPLGTASVIAIATDAAGNSASCSFTITVRDRTPPTVTCPAGITAEATHAAGAEVNYPRATATDAVTASPSISYNRLPGTVFPLGTTTVTVTARDGAGNSASCTFSVTVQDTTAPSMVCPTGITAEATGDSGALVSYPAATATDAVTASPVLSYSQDSGTVFPLGATAVTVTAKDTVGNTASCSFNITVQDTTVPSLACPTNVTAEATSASGATVLYAPATVSDSVTAMPVLTYSQAAGTVFPLGTTAVTVTATDAAGNAASCSFDITVGDTTMPEVTCPANTAAEATGASGAVVTYPAATASDTASMPVALSYSHAPGTLFPLGMTAVSVIATDAAGNVASCTFSVTVQDTTAPSVVCPTDITTEATRASGSTVSYAPAMASDIATATPELSYSQGSGTVFSLGGTEVIVTARDEAGNTATCSFSVTVQDTTAPSVACPTDATVEATSALGGVLEYAPAVASDAVTALPEIIYSHASATVFPLGATGVTVIARDAAGNESTCHFTVAVRDTTPPSVGCTANLTVEAEGTEGTPVPFELANPLDTVTRSPQVASSHAPGSRFPLGTTAVTVTARDEADNVASCTFSITVQDTTPPALVCPEDMTFETKDAEGAAVTFTALARDTVTGLPGMTYSHASGSLFPPGTTPVTVSTRDDAGMTSECTFRVTVRQLVPEPAPEKAGGCASVTGTSVGGAGSLWLLLLGSAVWFWRGSRTRVR
ncbi:ELWxxDGT repeat-containing protein [Stigmatella aurantiaca]|uniref:ELWxxDGT repeat-containing protein n=1 Tax=Stigmatella aurantiaca TaxID=41 RepID=A0A1H7Q4I0_STIAU|nr:ELWxxDGT repeat protein [Stigmatella aurantiaca]SEL42628.1 ELWxxDGT repeat-containing protein [Stigmatella aurantiaca]